MTTLELTGWRPGLNTVALIDAVRTSRNKSLIDAKRTVERLLAGETVLLEFDTEEEKQAFRRTAESLGAVIGGPDK
jgi:hypothetical protein